MMHIARSYENIHIMLWLGKDFAWSIEVFSLWVVFAVPTFLVGCDMVYSTLAHYAVNTIYNEQNDIYIFDEWTKLYLQFYLLSYVNCSYTLYSPFPPIPYHTVRTTTWECCVITCANYYGLLGIYYGHLMKLWFSMEVSWCNYETYLTPPPSTGGPYCSWCCPLSQLSSTTALSFPCKYLSGIRI